MNNNGYIYRCTKECPWNKQCFIVKTSDELKDEIPVLFKCKVSGNEILINIGQKSIVHS